MTPAAAAAPPPPLRWDVFCRVIDNHGDLGVCWRLSADLASRGHAVRLWADDASALAWMAPGGHAGVAVGAFDDAARAEPAQVVVEAFGCDPPAAFVARMAKQRQQSVWINLEYLSAEPWVERSHGLPSPQLAAAGAGLTKWFFFPGFTDRTGGVICEPGLPARRRAFDAAAWRAAFGALPASAAERVVSLFCYDGAPVAALLNRLSALGGTPMLLLAAPGAASRHVAAALGPALRRDGLRAVLLPYRSQADFDHLLWASDLNVVRGEDSFVRAQLAGVPFVWQAYPQSDGAHAAKLAAFSALYFDAEPGLASGIVPFWQAWNGLAAALPPLPPLPELAPWRAHAERWCTHLQRTAARGDDLTGRLIDFARRRIAERR